MQKSRIEFVLGGTSLLRNRIVWICYTVTALFAVGSVAQNASAETTVKIALTQPWTDTGISVNAAQRIEITTTGSMNWFTGGCPQDGACTSTPDGSSVGLCPKIVAQYFAPTMPCWGVMGKIGADGTPFKVGSHFAAAAAIGGELFLGVNDDNYADNSGTFLATVQLGAAPPNRHSSKMRKTVSASIPANPTPQKPIHGVNLSGTWGDKEPYLLHSESSGFTVFIVQDGTSVLFYNDTGIAGKANSSKPFLVGKLSGNTFVGVDPSNHQPKTVKILSPDLLDYLDGLYRISPPQEGDANCESPISTKDAPKFAYFRGKDAFQKQHYRAAECWFKISADRGFSPAQTILAAMLYEGTGGLPRDQSRAFDLAVKGSAGEMVGADLLLARMFHDGVGHPIDTRALMHWHCNDGPSESCFKAKVTWDRADNIFQLDTPDRIQHENENIQRGMSIMLGVTLQMMMFPETNDCHPPYFANEYQVPWYGCEGVEPSRP